MSNDKLQKELFTKRVFLLGACKLILLSALACRLFFLQIIEGQKYKTLSDENRISTKPLLAERGIIVDRFGKPLATNMETYRLLFMPEQISYAKESYSELQKILRIEKTYEEIIKKLKDRPNYPLILEENLSWKDVIQIETRLSDLPGIQIEKYKKRQYTNGPVLSSILGYIGPISEKEQDMIQFCSPEQRIGKSGIEKQYDAMLQGEFGFKTVEVNARGRVVRELETNLPKKGELITLSLDYDLQEFTYHRLGENPAAAITMNVKNGEILSLVSKPGFDPHLFLNGIRPDDWNQLRDNELTPLINRALQGYYAPGSIFKIVVALAAFEKGVVKPHERVSCCGFLNYGKHKFHCWAKNGHGPMNLAEALQRSCDVYFYTIADRVGVKAIADMARNLGLGNLTGIDLPGEKQGLVPDPAWKKKRFKQPWNKSETMMMGIGQSYLLVTPLQLAVMMARIANGGYKITPTLHQDTIEEGLIKPKEEQQFEKLTLSQEAIDVVLDALNKVTNVTGGTGFQSRITEKGFEMAGKSSSTQVKRITLEDRQKGLHKNENRPWHERDHAMFAGFAPLHDPQYVTIVVVEHGGSGGKTAAPIVRDILLKAQKLTLSRREHE